MLAVGIRAFKNKLSEYVRRARGGETILITDRDRVVAELNPPRAGRAERVEDEALARLIREGLVTPRQSDSKEPPPRLPVMSMEELLRELDQARADRF